MSNNFSIEGWQGILRGQAMPGDIMCGESIAVYVHRKFETLIAEREALQQLLNDRDEKIDAGALPAEGTDYDYRSDLGAYFGLSYASWLTLPRVLMQAMPKDWQSRMALLLHEYEDAYQNPPDYQTTVRVKLSGKMIKTPAWLINYRHPDHAMIEQVRGTRAVKP